MSEIEKLRALLAEARDVIGHLESCRSCGDGPICSDLAGPIGRIDAALAEPVVEGRDLSTRFDVLRLHLLHARNEAQAEVASAYQRGAEAMREAAARAEPYAYNLDDHLMISKWRAIIRALPVPEDKP